MPAPTSPELRRLMAEYTDCHPRPVSLSELLAFGTAPSQNSVLASARYTLSELPRRLVKRVQAFESLPYIVGTNPFISSILRGYRNSFVTIAKYPEIATLQDNKAFVPKLNDIVKSHSNDIATMAKGFQECTRYMLPQEITTFLDETISARIALRLIAEQHVAISRAFEDPQSGEHHVGVVDLECSPGDMIRMCASYVTELCEGTLGAAPSVVLDGEVGATFAYVPVHLEYILTEILKNSFRASVEHHHRQFGRSSRGPIPRIQLTIAPPIRRKGRANYLSLRVRDEGGGIPTSQLDQIFSYAFTTAGRGAKTDSDDEGGPYAAQHVGGMASVDESSEGGFGVGSLFGEITGKGLQTGLGTIAGLGYGLPMARLYAAYFSGSLQLHSLYGHGTDCFIKLRCLNDGADVQV